MNTLEIESELANKYYYQNLPKDLSEKYRKLFLENIPDFLKAEGDNITLYTLNNSPICSKYNRIVVGDYGAFIEFEQEDICTPFCVKDGQEYRINNPNYSKNVKYLWYTINDGSDIKIYYQKRKVSYADYRRGKFYISVHEVKN